MENRYFCVNCGEIKEEHISGYCCIGCGSDDIFSDYEDNL